MSHSILERNVGWTNNWSLYLQSKQSLWIYHSGSHGVLIFPRWSPSPFRWDWDMVSYKDAQWMRITTSRVVYCRCGSTCLPRGSWPCCRSSRRLPVPSPESLTHCSLLWSPDRAIANVRSRSLGTASPPALIFPLFCVNQSSLRFHLRRQQIQVLGAWVWTQQAECVVGPSVFPLGMGLHSVLMESIQPVVLIETNSWAMFLPVLSY